MALPSIGGDASQNIGLAPLPRKKRNTYDVADRRWRPGTREVVPEAVCPNLRSNGRTLNSQAPRILQNNQRQYGYTFFSEAAFRGMHKADTGYNPGVGTFPAWCNRAAERGEVHVMWLTRGGVMPDGSPCEEGVCLIRYATSDKERARFREAYARNVKEHGKYVRERTQGATHRAVYNAMRARSVSGPIVRPPPASSSSTRPTSAWQKSPPTAAQLAMLLEAAPKEAPS